MISNDTKFGYEKILGLRGDRTKKRSLEARADAFSRLKILEQKSNVSKYLTINRISEILFGNTNG